MISPVVLSIVVPAYNEEALLDASVRQLRRSLDALGVAT